jgi:hypothetical protein
VKDSAYWLRVAKLVHDGAVRGEKYMGLCNGIARAVDDEEQRWKMWDAIDYMYEPRRKRAFWWSEPGTSKKGDNASVLAALFLREMALDDEGRK